MRAFRVPAPIEIKLFCAMSSQVLQWTFAAAPGHPALREMCDHISRSVDQRFSGDKNFDTLERTGPGPFTDVILRNAQLHPLSKVSAPMPLLKQQNHFYGGCCQPRCYHSG
jgi:hypothetical protein